MQARLMISFKILVVAALLTGTEGWCQFNTPTVNGSIGAGEYGTHTNGQNQESNGSQIWYMTWDDTYLYVAETAGNLAEGAVLYVDHNPVTPINGGATGDGTIVGQNYDGASFAALPFRADFVTYFKNGYHEYRTANGSGGWSSSTANTLTYSSSGTTRELRIPWSAITGGSRPASFLFFAYITSAGGFVYAEMPTDNPSGTIGTSARFEYYYTVSDTGNGTSTKPFSRKSYVFNSTSSHGSFVGITVYDFTMNNSSLSITRAAGTWSISGTLRVHQGTISYGAIGSGNDATAGDVVIENGGVLTLSTSGSDLIVSGDLTANSGGTLTLSTTSGSNLHLQGDLNNNGGTLTWNSRAVFFEGTSLSDIGGSSPTTFAFFRNDKTGGGSVRLQQDISLESVSGTNTFRNSGTFNANGREVTFLAGANNHELTADTATAFFDLTIQDGATVIETVSADNVSVTGTLDNQGTLRKTQTISGGPVTFGLTGATIDVTTVGTLSQIVVDRIGDTAPSPAAFIDSTRYWTLTPTGAGYTLNLTLPHTLGAGHASAALARFDGGDWDDLARTSSTTTTVTRNGITTLSPWAIADLTPVTEWEIY